MHYNSDYITNFYKGVDLSSLKKLTLIIPTHNRNYYLSRCLSYHAHFPFGKIIIADSSNHEKKEVNRDVVSRIVEEYGIDILYIPYESENDVYGRDIYRKWGDALSHVSTDYSVITTDKQFTIPDILARGVELLEMNENYVLVDYTKCRIQLDFNNGPVVYLDRNYTKTPVAMNCALSRYEMWCNSGINASLFAIYKSSIQKSIYNQASKLDIRFAEIFLNISGVICGDVAISNESISTCRDLTRLYDNLGNVDDKESSTMQYPSLRDYKSLGIFDECYSMFKNELVELFLKQGYTLSETQITNLLLMLNTPNGVYTNQSIIGTLRNSFIFDKLWHTVPQNIKYKIKERIGFDGIKISEIPPNISIINKYIVETLHLHKKDMPIF